MDATGPGRVQWGAHEGQRRTDGDAGLSEYLEDVLAEPHPLPVPRIVERVLFAVEARGDGVRRHVVRHDRQASFVRRAQRGGQDQGVAPIVVLDLSGAQPQKVIEMAIELFLRVDAQHLRERVHRAGDDKTGGREDARAGSAPTLYRLLLLDDPVTFPTGTCDRGHTPVRERFWSEYAPGHVHMAVDQARDDRSAIDIEDRVGRRRSSSASADRPNLAVREEQVPQSRPRFRSEQPAVADEHSPARARDLIEEIERQPLIPTGSYIDAPQLTAADIDQVPIRRPCREKGCPTRHASRSRIGVKRANPAFAAIDVRQHLPIGRERCEIELFPRVLDRELAGGAAEHQLGRHLPSLGIEGQLQIDQTPAVGGPTQRPHVDGPRVIDRPTRAAPGRDDVQRPALHVNDAVPGRVPEWVRNVTGRIGELPARAALQIEEVQLVVATPVGHESDRAAVGRPGRIAVVGGTVRQALHPTVGGPQPEIAERGEGDAGSIGGRSRPIDPARANPLSRFVQLRSLPLVGLTPQRHAGDERYRAARVRRRIERSDRAALGVDQAVPAGHPARRVWIYLLVVG